MFWEYHADRTGALLDTLDSVLWGGDVLPLSGVWRFELDPADEGLVASWENRTLADRIRLPGPPPGPGLRRRRLGRHEVDRRDRGQVLVHRAAVRAVSAAGQHQGAVLAPARQALRRPRLVPARRRVPAGLAGQAGRAAPRAAALGDARLARRDELVGSNDSLSTPHEYDLGAALAPGKHRLTIRVDNRMVVDVGVNSHSVTDHTQGNWNGIVGPDRAVAPGRPVWIDDLQVYPQRGRASRSRVRGQDRQRDRRGRPGTRNRRLRSVASRRQRTAPRRPPLASKDVRRVVGRRRAAPSRPSRRSARRAGSGTSSRPCSYRLAATLEAGEARRHARGHASACARSPRRARSSSSTAARPSSAARWSAASSRRPAIRRPTSRPGSASSRIAKAHGLNLIRFHSWCPPEAAFVAADELGFYYHVECASWANSRPRSATASRSTSGSTSETDRILEGLRQPPVVRPDALRQRAGRAKTPEYLGRLGRALQGAGPAPAVHERRRLAADPREPVPRHARPAHPGLGRGAQVAHQRAAAGDAHRLPRLRPKRAACR